MNWEKKWVLTYADGTQETIFADNFFDLYLKVKGKKFININYDKE